MDEEDLAIGLNPLWAAEHPNLIFGLNYDRHFTVRQENEPRRSLPPKAAPGLGYVAHHIGMDLMHAQTLG